MLPGEERYLNGEVMFPFFMFCIGSPSFPGPVYADPVVFQEKYPAISATDPEMIPLVFKAVWTDIVAEVVPFSHPVFEIKMKRLYSRQSTSLFQNSLCCGLRSDSSKILLFQDYLHDNQEKTFRCLFGWFWIYC